MSGLGPDDDEDVPEPARLRHLRWLVNGLTITLIVGFVIIVGALVIRLTRAPAPLRLPESVRVPAGERVRAVTLGGDWIAVVTVDGNGEERIRVLDRASGAQRAEVAIPPD